MPYQSAIERAAELFFRESEAYCQHKSLDVGDLKMIYEEIQKRIGTDDVY